ncbi:MAG TPA: hypothetical protein VKR54_00115 [Candidatus Babeliales bacterium]|nr:hypothetical protein [Candidatus Babeliales bacterium]
MKKIILIGVVVLVSLLGVMFIKNRFGGGTMSSMSQQEDDLVIVNDSSDTISTEYQEDGEAVDQLLEPGDIATGGQGFIRVFTAKKAGLYELEYPFPRPADAPRQVTLSQITGAVKNETTADGEIYIKKGMVGDIAIEYEEVQEQDGLEY